MAKRGALIPLGGGRYAIAEPGATSLATNTTWQVALDAELDPLGPYYIGFITALEDHRLTDLEESDITAAIGFHNDRLERSHVTVAGRPLRVTTMRPKALAFGTETVHQSRNRRYRRSDLERTLIDCHERPKMVGSAEVWIRAWGRAFGEERVDVERVVAYSSALGTSASRRTAVLLTLLGHGMKARDSFEGRLRRADRIVPFIAGQPIAADADVDPYWRVAWNLPEGLIRGWLAYGR
jgi:predicted transcriptional regulator of viral defense system